MQQRPFYIDNRASSVTSKGVVGFRGTGAPFMSPLLPTSPAYDGYGGGFWSDVGDYFTGKTARQEAKRNRRRKEKAVERAQLALIEASAQNNEVEGPGLVQWVLLLVVGAGVIGAIWKV
jgi:hypothetical protein